MRIKELQAWLTKQNIDFVLLLNTSLAKQDPNLSYFTQLQLEFACLVIPKNKKSFLLTSAFEKDRVKKHSKIKNVMGKKKGKLFEQIKSQFRNKRIKKIGINKNIFTLNEYKILKKQFKKCKFIDISSKLVEIRQIKTNEEIKIIKKSVSIASLILEKCIKNIKALKTEVGIKNYLESETKRQNCELAFPPVVASGPNASYPHHVPQNKLNKGFCVIDFGVNYRGYHSDITRTIYVGKPSKKEIEIYNLLLAIQKNVITKISVGKKCSDLYNQVKKDLKSYQKYFTHGLGHGIGVEIHENPNLSPNSKDKVSENMIFTIEPGIYIKNRLGIRIEDDILVKKDNVEILSKIKKDLIIK